MSLKNRLRVAMVCAMLQFGVAGGMPMRPDEVQELLHQMNQPKMAHVLPSKGNEGEDPLEPKD